ncbi:hypothetical protein BpHYR1_021932 [Brachionus plicatilis]|uniref:Uncharacterized protein n=1 Tax=Brachionus plicatilis TaxID=10195 RepID=A0A3M7RRB3_BRAPC|nr:hypothetical protein BpHYR1_021932 [Brachionus plicatilis]
MLILPLLFLSIILFLIPFPNASHLAHFKHNLPNKNLARFKDGLRMFPPMLKDLSTEAEVAGVDWSIPSLSITQPQAYVETIKSLHSF